MYRGIIAIATLIIALISWFLILTFPVIASIKNKGILIRTAALPIFISVATVIDLIKDKYGFPRWISADTIHNIIIITIISLFALGVGSLLTTKNRSFFPFLSNILTIITFVIIINFSKIAYDMWDKDGDGSVRYGDDTDLANIHALFIIISIILMIVLGIRLFKPSTLPNWVYIISSVIYLICMNVSFFYTCPRGGDEGIMLWMFIIPAFILADLALFATIIVGSIVSGVRQIS